MKLVKQSVEIITDINNKEVMELLEKAGRTCYKSEDSIKDGSCDMFIDKIANQLHHESVIEHYNVTVKIVTDRGITHEIVRHRLASYSQESTRYCNYGKGKFGQEITCIDLSEWLNKYQLNAMYKGWKEAEVTYFQLLDRGVKAQIARNVLPNGLKTELIMTANLRQWRHILRMRTSKAAHPQVRALMYDLWEQLESKLPVLFKEL